METSDDIRDRLRKQRERWLRERDIDKDKQGNKGVLNLPEIESEIRSGPSMGAFKQEQPS